MLIIRDEKGGVLVIQMPQSRAGDREEIVTKLVRITEINPYTRVFLTEKAAAELAEEIINRGGYKPIYQIDHRVRIEK